MEKSQNSPNILEMTLKSCPSTYWIPFAINFSFRIKNARPSMELDMPLVGLLIKQVTLNLRFRCRFVSWVEPIQLAF